MIRSTRITFYYLTYRFLHEIQLCFCLINNYSLLGNNKDFWVENIRSAFSSFVSFIRTCKRDGQNFCAIASIFAHEFWNIKKLRRGANSICLPPNGILNKQLKMYRIQFLLLSSFEILISHSFLYVEAHQGWKANSTLPRTVADLTIHTNKSTTIKRPQWNAITRLPHEPEKKFQSDSQLLFYSRKTRWMRQRSGVLLLIYLATIETRIKHQQELKTCNEKTTMEIRRWVEESNKADRQVSPAYLSFPSTIPDSLERRSPISSGDIIS